MLNRIEMIGRFGADPEARETPNGYKYARFSVPLFHGFNNQSEKTSWVTCEAWNKLGELVVDRGKKGMLVWIEGELSIDNWESEGEKRSRTYIRVNGIRFLEKTESSGKQFKDSGSQQKDKKEQKEQKEQKVDNHSNENDFPAEEEIENMDELFNGFNFSE